MDGEVYMTEAEMKAHCQRMAYRKELADRLRAALKEIAGNGQKLMASGEIENVADAIQYSALL